MDCFQQHCKGKVHDKISVMVTSAIILDAQSPSLIQTCSEHQTSSLGLDNAVPSRASNHGTALKKREGGEGGILNLSVLKKYQELFCIVLEKTDFCASVVCGVFSTLSECINC